MLLRLIRALMVASAVVVAAWFVFSIHAVDLQASGEATLKRAQRGAISQAELQRARDELRRADRHNADLAPLLDEGFLLAAAGHRDQAFPIAIRTVEKEPLNVQSWALFYVAAPNANARAFAGRKVKELNPWLAYALR
jgi:hypothetical protein